MVICYCGEPQAYPRRVHSGTESRMGLPLIRFHFLAVSLVVIHFSLISSQQRTPPFCSLFTFSSRNLFNQTSPFSFYDIAPWSLLLRESDSCVSYSHSLTPSLYKHRRWLNVFVSTICFYSFTKTGVLMDVYVSVSVLVTKRDVSLTGVFCFRWEARPGGGLGGLPASSVSGAPEGL